jgi:hypothetical protein
MEEDVMTTPKKEERPTPENLPVLRRVTIADIKKVEEHLRKRRESTPTEESTRS